MKHTRLQLKRFSFHYLPMVPEAGARIYFRDDLPPPASGDISQLAGLPRARVGMRVRRGDRRHDREYPETRLIFDFRCRRRRIAPGQSGGYIEERQYAQDRPTDSRRLCGSTRGWRYQLVSFQARAGHIPPPGQQYGPVFGASIAGSAGK
jgi:hypothetical protein